MCWKWACESRFHSLKFRWAGENICVVVTWVQQLWLRFVMGTPDFYGSLSSPEMATVFFLFCVVCCKEENHRVEHRCRSYKSVTQGGLMGGWVHRWHPTSIYLDKLGCGHLYKNQRFSFHFGLCPEAWLCDQWGYTFWSPSAGRCGAGLALVAKHTGILRHKVASSVLVVPTQEFVRGSQTQGTVSFKKNHSVRVVS